MKKITYIIELVFVLLLIFCMRTDAQALNIGSPYRLVEDPEGVYVVEINTSKVKSKLIPYVSETLETNKEVFQKTGAKLVVNAGFFDPNNKKTVSYVYINGNCALNPEDNENLMQNKILSPYMDKILNRSEFRILEDSKGNIVYDIVPHNEIAPTGYKIKHSIQAGPMLFPDLRLEEEFFILVKDGKIASESASALHKYARTAIGIRDNNVYLFIVTNKAKMNLAEVANLARKWGMEKAMAFDGGGSTSFNSKELDIFSDKDNNARKLKSFLILH